MPPPPISSKNKEPVTYMTLQGKPEKPPACVASSCFALSVMCLSTSLTLTINYPILFDIHPIIPNDAPIALSIRTQLALSYFCPFNHLSFLSSLIIHRLSFASVTLLL
jgi:hypothetical protein